MIKTVFIDIDDTLLDFGKCAESSVRLAMRDTGLEYKDEYFDVFIEINKQLWQQIEKKTLTPTQLYKTRWNIIFKALSIEGDGESFENKFLGYLDSSHEPVENALGLLEYLSGKYTLCAASNAPLCQQLTRLRKAGMLKYFNHVFISEAAGHSKPSKEFFDYCFSFLPSAIPEESIIIGDSLTSDISGGLQYGIKTCLFDPTGKTDIAGIAVDYKVNSLEEIKNFL